MTTTDAPVTRPQRRPGRLADSDLGRDLGALAMSVLLGGALLTAVVGGIVATVRVLLPALAGVLG